MKIEQITTTKIIADEGKVFRHKITGALYGSEITLGYNYYEAGLPLQEGKLQTPDDFEEIDAPEDTVEFSINQAKRLKLLTNILKEIKSNISDYNLTTEEMLEFKDYFPIWGIDFKEGDVLNEGNVFLYENKLYKVLQNHTIHSHYEPSEYTTSFYTEIS